MFRFNIPLTKVDEEKRLVYGLVTEEIVDQAGEILDYDTSKSYFEEWSAGISKATGGMSLGNLRLMHQPVVAGKLTELNFDDATKQISCVAKVVDQAAWDLVLEGCLTGFSMGGKYIKRWKDEANKGVTRFTAKPVEVSIVDNPCVSTATFEYVKSDGSVELRKFHAGDGNQETTKMFTEEQIAARAAELAKAAGTPDAADQFRDEALVQLEGEAEANKAAADSGTEGAEEGTQPAPGPAETTEAAASGDDTGAQESVSEAPTEEQVAEAAKSVVQVWQAPDGTTFAKKADAALHVIANPAAPPAQPESLVEKALREARGEADAAPADGSVDDLQAIDADLGKALETFTAAEEHVLPLAKSMYSVRSLSSVITDLRYVIADLCCDQSGGTASPIPAALVAHLKGLAENLVALTEEEVASMITHLGNNYPAILGTVENAVVAEFSKADSSIMQKAGARNSKKDAATVQKMHDHSVELGAACGAAEKAAGADEGEDDVAKSLRIDNERLTGEVSKAIEGIAELGELVKSQAATITELTEKVEKFGKSPQPLPPRTDHVVVDRFGKSETLTQDAIEKMSPEDRADLAIRLSQTAPIHVGGQVRQ